MKTDDGITGVSETYGGEAPLAALESAKARVIGMDPFRLAGLWREFQTTRRPPQRAIAARRIWYPGENPMDQHTRTYAAIEVACLDIVGKAVGKPGL
jgi:glucarate dehydratase